MNAPHQPDELDLSGADALIGGTDTATHPELVAVLDALRVPAASSELAASAGLVPQLAAAARQSVAPGALARGTRRMVVLGATGAMMAGGVAAAATGALDPILADPEPPAVVELVEVQDEATPKAEEDEEDEDDGEIPVEAAPAAGVSAEMPDDPPGWLTEEIQQTCTDPDANHGVYVSTVAQLDDDELGEEAANRGQVVSQAARDQDCDGEADENPDDEAEKKDKGRHSSPDYDHDDDDDDERGSGNGHGQGGEPKKDKSDDD
ncbi:MAG: hypothetical protein GY929_08480 [Actinomycetia bacterium]|nr:hypothetical protein [Actinomycetes bacterium]